MQGHLSGKWAYEGLWQDGDGQAFLSRICLACSNVPGHLTCHSPLSGNSSRICRFLENGLLFRAFSSTSKAWIWLWTDAFYLNAYHFILMSSILTDGIIPSFLWQNIPNSNLLFLPFHFLVLLKDTLRSIDNVSEYHATQSECPCLERQILIVGCLLDASHWGELKLNFLSLTSRMAAGGTSWSKGVLTLWLYKSY